MINEVKGKIPPCRYNIGVGCAEVKLGNKEACETCGWNPDVEVVRKERLFSGSREPEEDVYTVVEEGKNNFTILKNGQYYLQTSSRNSAESIVNRLNTDRG